MVRNEQRLTDDLAARAFLAGEVERALGPSTAVRTVIESNELWAYGDGRSCRIDVDGDHFGVVFLVGSKEVAHAAITVTEIGATVAAWTEALVPLADLSRVCTALLIEPHAELLERGEVARWHWRRALDEARVPDSTLARFLTLIERIVDHPSIARFFSFTSHGVLCFSASSTFPFVTEGLPIVRPSAEGGYVIEEGDVRQRGDVDETLARIDDALAQSPHRPFVGAVDHLMVQDVNAELARRGRSLRAVVRQYRQWYRTVLERGPRSCAVLKVGAPSSPWWALRFVEQPTGPLADVAFRDGASAIRGACRWIEESVSLDEARAEALKVIPPFEYFDLD